MTKDQHENILMKLKTFSQLENNWDGEGGVVPKTNDINNAIKFLDQIKERECSAPIPMISNDGEIGLFWRNNESGLYIDLGFNNGGFSYYSVDEDNKEYFSDQTKYREDLFSELLNMLEGE